MAAGNAMICRFAIKGPNTGAKNPAATLVFLTVSVFNGILSGGYTVAGSNRFLYEICKTEFAYFILIIGIYLKIFTKSILTDYALN